MTPDPSKMAFPMIALGDVTVGSAKYAAGELFDARIATDCKYLGETTGYAENYDPAKHQAVAPQASEVVQTEERRAPKETKTESSPNAAKGKTYAKESSPPGRPVLLRERRRS